MHNLLGICNTYVHVRTYFILRIAHDNLVKLNSDEPIQILRSVMSTSRRHFIIIKFRSSEQEIAFLHSPSPVLSKFAKDQWRHRTEHG